MRMCCVKILSEILFIYLYFPYYTFFYYNFCFRERKRKYNIYHFSYFPEALTVKNVKQSVPQI